MYVRTYVHMGEWGHPDRLVKADNPVLARICYLVKCFDMW